MASLSQTCRLLRSAQLSKQVLSRRGFRSSGHNAVAQGFKMPAMSPTMMEGNIAKWSLKEGDKFSAGDVLLEIETDKAHIDVEASEDGVLAKILVQDGAKGIKVGTRIAVIAEQDDDLATLEIPPEPKAKTATPPTEAKAEKSSSATPPSQPSSSSHTSTSKSHPTPKEPHTPSPSVASLLKIHGLKKEDFSNIQGTGPRGRLLKGDVLAFVGSIHIDGPRQLEANFDKLAHLDLSNITILQAPKKVDVAVEEAAAPKKVEVAVEEAAAPPETQDPLEVVLRYPVSLEKLEQLQNKIQESLGFNPPVSAFFAEASRLASKDLPKSKLPPTADQIFDELVGAPAKVSAKVAYEVKLETAPISKPPPRSTEDIDIIDFLSGSKLKASSPKPAQPSADAPATQTFATVKVRAEDKARGDAFLSRVAEYVRDDPQSLVYSLNRSSAESWL
ncbi:hypothetical protein DFH27DRAFT_509044 [Peziza echinospora]|nr:hypothetical protein DFH27DRAFT_509044 [Peziza echinospora]